MKNLLVWTYYLAGRYDQGLVLAKRQAELDPTDAVGHLNLGQIYQEKGMYLEAVAEMKEAVALADTPYPLGLLCESYARAGRRADALATLDSLRGQARVKQVSALSFAFAYSGLGNKDEAFRWLERARGNRDEDLMYLRVDPKLRELRGDPRFHHLLREMNLGS